LLNVKLVDASRNQKVKLLWRTALSEKVIAVAYKKIPRFFMEPEQFTAIFTKLGIASVLCAKTLLGGHVWLSLVQVVCSE
jgi:hypothetical protein